MGEGILGLLLILFGLPIYRAVVCVRRLFNPRDRGSRGAAREVLGCLGWFLLLGLIVALLLPATGAARGAARRSHCANNLKQISLAMRNYSDSHGCFPPAYTVDKAGRPLHSWRVLLLPFLEGKDLYDRIRLDEPHDSPHNQTVFERERAEHWESPLMPSTFFCPGDKGNRLDTNYVMLVGPNALSNGPNSVRLLDITDGESETIAVVETYDLGIRWYEPRDLRVEEMSFRINDPDHYGIASRHPYGGAHVGFVDAHTEFLTDDTDPRVVEALMTINGGEVSGTMRP